MAYEVMIHNASKHHIHHISYTHLGSDVSHISRVRGVGHQVLGVGILVDL